MDAITEQHIRNCDVCKKFFAEEHLFSDHMVLYMYLMKSKQGTLYDDYGQIPRNTKPREESEATSTSATPVSVSRNPLLNGSITSRTIPATASQVNVPMTPVAEPVQAKSTTVNPSTYVIKKLPDTDGSMTYIVSSLPSVEKDSLIEDPSNPITSTMQADDSSFVETCKLADAKNVSNANISQMRKDVDINDLSTDKNIQTGVMTSLMSRESVNAQIAKVMASLLSPGRVSSPNPKVETPTLSLDRVDIQKKKAIATNLFSKLTEKSHDSGVKASEPAPTAETDHSQIEGGDNLSQSRSADISSPADCAMDTSPSIGKENPEEKEIVNTIEILSSLIPSLEMAISQETEVMTSSPCKDSGASYEIEDMSSSLPPESDNSETEEFADDSSVIDFAPLSSTPSSQADYTNVPKVGSRRLIPREVHMQAFYSQVVIRELDVSEEFRQELLKECNFVNAVLRHVTNSLEMRSVKGKIMEEAFAIIRRFVPNLDLKNKRVVRSIKTKISKGINYINKKQRPWDFELQPVPKKASTVTVFPSKRTIDDGPDEELFKERNEICLTYEGLPVGKARVLGFPYKFHNIEVEDPREWVSVQLTLKRRNSKVPRLPLATDTRPWLDIGRGSKIAWKTSDVKKLEYYDQYTNGLRIKRRKLRKQNRGVHTSGDGAPDDSNMSDSQLHSEEETDMDEDS